VLEPTGPVVEWNVTLSLATVQTRVLVTAPAYTDIRLNPTHSYTVFRVRVEGLRPKTTYYYKVDSIDARGTSDGVTSPIKAFTTP